MKLSVVIVILFSWAFAYCSPAIMMSAHSFWGSYYYPERADKQFSYTEKQDLRFGFENLRSNDFRLDLTLQNREFHYRQRIELYSLQLNYDKYEDKSAGLLVGFIGYGKPSDFFDLDVSSPSYRTHRLSRYRFSGVRIGYKISSPLSAVHYIGGNPNNSAITTTEVSWEQNPLAISLFYLYAGRDNSFNRTMHSGGGEVIFESELIYFSLSQIRQHFSADKNFTNHLTYSEIITTILPGFRTGGTLFYAGTYRGHSSWREYSLQAVYSYKKLSKAVIFTDKETDLLESQQIGSILNFSISERFAIGLLSSVHFPQSADRYYSFGFQVQINEKFFL